MKKICLLCVLVTVLIVFAVPNTALAAGEAEVYFYDFEDYTAPEGSNIGPDEKWVDDDTSVYWSVDSYGSKDLSQSEDPEDAKHGRVFAIHRGQASMYFDKPLVDGKLHISFDARSTHPDLSALFHSYINDKGAPYSDGYAKYIFLNGFNPEQISYFTALLNWEWRHHDESVSTTQWHHYDIVMTGISGADARVREYVDGKLIFDGHRPDPMKGFITFSIRAGNRSGAEWPAVSEKVYLDNLMIRRYHNDAALTLISVNADTLPTDNAVVNVKLSERVNKTLTAEDVVISGPDGTPDYSIIDIDDTGFTVQFNEALPYGKYSITLVDSVTGAVSGTSVKEPLVLKTSDRFVDVVIDYIDENFNDYAGEGVLPEGFADTDHSTENGYAQKTLGSSGQEGDGAFGLCGFTSASRQIKRMFSEFTTAIPENTEYTVNFDIKAKNMLWYLHLPEAGDIEASESANVAIGADQNGALKYAGSRTTNPTSVIGDGITLEPEAWHTIRLTVVPDVRAGETKYKIRVDDGEEYILDTSRAFCLNQTEGIGFGYRENGNGAELHIDNLKVSVAQRAKFPETESITIYDYNGNEVLPSLAVTTKITEARIKYNTQISEEYTDFISLYKDGIETGYESDLIVNDDGTHTVVMYFPDMLEPMTGYRIITKEGLASKFTDEAVSYMTEEISIVTIKDTGYEINAVSYDDEKSEAVLEFIKNNDDEGRYIFAVCAYKDVAVNVDGEVKTVKSLSNMEFIPIDITSEMIGVLRYTLPISLDGEECEVVPYLWNYPKLDNAVLQ